MRRTLPIILVLCLALTAPAFAARVQSSMVTHIEQVYQACSATSDSCPIFAGYETGTDTVISAAPGVLSIIPQDEGETPWANFIGAAQEPIPVPYTIKNVSLTKTCPEYVQCNGVFPTGSLTQQGTPNIRLWWPLMYELPSCEITLNILYGTPVLYDDDGDGPNPYAWVHVEQWTWHVDATLESLSLLLELFHELPFGLDEVPLISDEPLYDELQGIISDTIAALDATNTAEAARLLTIFEMEVMDAFLDVSPAFPNPTGPGTGIANTEENPAACKLLVDVEYIMQTTGIGQQTKGIGQPGK